ncbi:hypothetical protein RKD29_007863 [Streptomyces tendae]
MVVLGTPRGSLHIPDAVLNLDGGVKPEMVATDNASYPDMVFGLFKILDHNFIPGSAAWTTSGSGRPPCPASRRARTARRRTWHATA